jgi:hypothetical protein
MLSTPLFLYVEYLRLLSLLELSHSLLGDNYGADLPTPYTYEVRRVQPNDPLSRTSAVPTWIITLTAE